jgi:LysM repeat protein
MSDRYVIEITLDGKDNVSQNLSKVNKELDELQQQGNRGTNAANNLAGGLGGLASAAGAVGLSFGLMEIGSRVIELNELGAEVRAANRVFTELAGGPQEAAKGLGELRRATNGVVDDMTLMRGANSLLLTGLAQTTEEAAGLTEVAVKLGGAMGQGPAEAIQNLNAALLNNSFERLDMLGISAANVRERVNELKASGMDMSAAFAQATMEEGREAIERLGTAADVANTALSRLGTRAQNFGQEVGSWINVGLEQGAQWLEDRLTTIDQMFALSGITMDESGNYVRVEDIRREAEAAAQEIENITTAWEDAPSNAEVVVGVTLENPEFANAVVSGEVAQQLLSGQTITSDVEVRYGLASGSLDFLNPTGTGSQDYGFDFLAGGFDPTSGFETTGDMDVMGERLQLLQVDYQDASREVAEYRLQVAETEQAEADLARAQNTRLAVSEASSLIFADLTDEMNAIQSGFNNINAAFEDGVFTSGGNAFFDPDAAAEVRAQAAGLADEYERLKMLNETNPELVTDTEVQRAREIANSAEKMANDAERMATSFANANLAQLTGTNNVDTLETDFNKMILGNIEDPELRAQMETQLNLNTGADNADLRAAEDVSALVATIAEEEGSAAGSRAAEIAAQAFRDGIEAGLHGEDLKTYVEEQVGFRLDDAGTGTGGGQEIQVEAGDTLSQISLDTGIPLSELIAANGGTSFITAGQVITVGDGTSLISLNEGSVPETINSAAANVFGTVGEGLSRVDYGTPEEQEQAPQTFTYFDPSTGTYTTSTNPEPIVSPEEAENVAAIEEDFISVETTINNIAAVDTSGTLAPLAEDISTASAELQQFESDLNAVISRDYRLRMPLVPFIDYAQIPELANNPNFAELLSTVIQNNPDIVTQVTGS